MLKRLSMINLGNRDGVTFEASKELLKIPDNEFPYNLTSFVGDEGSYAYSVGSIVKLMKCLQSLEEQPIVMRLNNYIYLDQIMF